MKNIFIVCLLMVFVVCCASEDKQSFIEKKRNSVVEKSINDYGELIVPPFLLEEYKEGKVELQ